ncbi:unnamed protein product [Thelazia callipaeda]|uniref:U4/U6.U5 tri-snRNP-associated protein 1 n=1 Tax=Thelazia callipaeda TaxID=103827 RepID=A0A0N5CMD1_THECL|nr:unnamed protein product [Thelazia callipaeda]
MGRESRHRRKRKTERNSDSLDGDKHRSASRSPERKSRRSDKGKHRDRSPVPSSTSKNETSMSVEETNKLRASLGLAPLELDDGPKGQDLQGTSTEKLYKEDGMEFVHKKAEHLGDKKKAEEIREKLQVARHKRKLYEKVLKVKGLADSDSEEGASAWVEKNRKLEEERKRAEERAKILDDMDADFGVNALISERSVKPDLSGLIVGHAREDFMEGGETILVLEDKGVLDEGEEVLVNPNLIEDERHKKNLELKKKKGHYESYAEEFDEYGMPKEKSVLSKYDEDLEGETKKTFRLGKDGNVDASKEAEELKMRRKLFMANKQLESLEPTKYTVASEFYTQEEMLAFRRPKSKKEKKLRKRKEKILKADDLIPDEDALTENIERSEKLASRKRVDDELAVKEEENLTKNSNLEDGELPEEDEKKTNWRAAETSAYVDLQNLNRLIKKVEEEEDDDDDDDDGFIIFFLDFVNGVDLSNVVIEDDAEEELTQMLDRTRRLKQYEIKADDIESDAALKIHELMKEHSIKDEPIEFEDKLHKVGVVIDSTMEYCRNLGEIPTYGLAGNRQDLEVKGLNQTDIVKPELREEQKERDSSSELHRIRKKLEQESKGRWTEASVFNYGDQKQGKSAFGGSDESDEETHNVLGEERDVTKGVAAMLKSAAEKGYLDTGKERKVKGPSLKHLESKRFSQIEISRYDIEEKYTKKLERMGTTGTGPVRPFPEKNDYKPDIRITYVDERGKEMESKDAFRVLSWKFHGKGPGKKQIEKRQGKQEKKELMKKMNSMDTPLGTLNKQLKKQEVMQTPYIVLSGSGRDTGYVGKV